MQIDFKNVLLGLGASTIVIASLFVAVLTFQGNSDITASLTGSSNNGVDLSIVVPPGDSSFDESYTCNTTNNNPKIESNEKVTSFSPQPNGDLFVLFEGISPGGPSVYKYDSSGKKTKLVFKNRQTQKEAVLINPTDMATDDNGNIYIAQSAFLLKFEPNPAVPNEYLSSASWYKNLVLIKDVKKIAIHDDIIYVAIKNKNIQAYDLEGKLISEIASYADLGDVGGFAFGTDGVVYATSSSLHIVNVISNYKIIGFWGVKGTSGNTEKLFNTPKSIGIGPEGYVYVFDSLNTRIKVYEESGNFKYLLQGTFTNTGTGNINNIIGFDKDGNGLVSLNLIENGRNYNIIQKIKLHSKCGTLVLIKNVQPDTDKTTFKFNITDDSTSAIPFFEDLSLINRGSESYIVTPGAYSIQELNAKNYATKFECTSSNPGNPGWKDSKKIANIKVAPEETITCVFTNKYCPEGTICSETDNKNSGN